MKALILVVALIVILLLAAQAHAQVRTDMATLIDAVVANAKATALNSRSVKWDSVQTAMHQSSKNAKSLPELRESLEILLVSLNDKQGTFYDVATSSPIASYPHQQGSKLAIDTDVKFDYRILHHQNVRYLRLVAAPAGSDPQKEAELIRQAVDSLSKEDAPYWIIDLRYAVGGEMNPLFAGLGPLLDEGLIATTVDGKEQIKDLYTVHNGNFYDNRVPVAKFPLSLKDMRSARIAVLTSKYTSGAAEILALAFKGRKNTKLFGETTAGQITGTNSIKISSNLVMSISETIYTDRRGTSYNDNVVPDTIIEFIPNSDIKHDKAIEEASLWLTTTKVSETAAAKVTMN